MDFSLFFDFYFRNGRQIQGENFFNLNPGGHFPYGYSSTLFTTMLLGYDHTFEILDPFFFFSLYIRFFNLLVDPDRSAGLEHSVGVGRFACRILRGFLLGFSIVR